MFGKFWKIYHGHILAFKEIIIKISRKVLDLAYGGKGFHLASYTTHTTEYHKDVGHGFGSKLYTSEGDS